MCCLYALHDQNGFYHTCPIDNFDHVDLILGKNLTVFTKIISVTRVVSF